MHINYQIVGFVFLAIFGGAASNLDADNLGRKLCAERPFEYYIDGGPQCQVECENLFQVCEVFEVDRVVRDCFCLPGYARTRFGECVPLPDERCIAEIPHHRLYQIFPPFCRPF